MATSFCLSLLTLSPRLKCNTLFLTPFPIQFILFSLVLSLPTPAPPRPRLVKMSLDGREIDISYHQSGSPSVPTAGPRHLDARLCGVCGVQDAGTCEHCVNSVILIFSPFSSLSSFPFPGHEGGKEIRTEASPETLLKPSNIHISPSQHRVSPRMRG